MSDNTRGSGFVIEEQPGSYDADIGGLIVGELPDREKLDLGSQIRDIAKRAQRRREREGGGLVLDILEDETLMTLANGIESQTDRLIREAEELIAEREYEAALERLESALAGSPNEPTALLLKGECLSHFDGRALLAIETTRPLVSAELIPRLERRFSRLLSELREALVPEMFQEFITTLEKQGPAAAAREMEKYRKAEPGIEDVYFLGGSGLMMAGDFNDAEAMLREGRLACRGQECLRLEMLERNLATEQLMAAMREAVQLLKDGARAKAVARLASRRSAGAGMELYQDLCSFAAAVKKAGGFPKGKSGSSKPARGRRDNLECFFLQPEFNAAVRLVGEERFDDARKVLVGALKYMPDSTLANFLIAHSIFVGVMKATNKSRKPSLDTIKRQLRTARSHVVKALPNPKITAAAGLKKSLDEIMTRIAEGEKSAADSKKYGPLIGEFNEMMQAVKRKGGFQSEFELLTFKNKMVDLAGRVAVARTVASSPISGEMQKLGKAIKAVIGQIPL